LAAATLRRQERRVGLDEHAVGRYVGGDLAQCLVLRVGQRAGEGDVEAPVERAPALVAATAEAVHDAVHGRFVLEHCEQRRERVAAVEDDRQIQLARERQVPPQRLFLLRQRRAVAVAIEARFADRRTAGVARQFFDRGPFDVEPVAVVGVQAGGPPYAWQQGQSLRREARRGVDADDEQPPHAGVERAPVVVSLRRLVVEADVAVGVVDLHHEEISGSWYGNRGGCDRERSHRFSSRRDPNRSTCPRP
jgi:hypothetical protein